jgi:hypothetical protein
MRAASIDLVIVGKFISDWFLITKIIETNDEDKRIRNEKSIRLETKPDLKDFIKNLSGLAIQVEVI